LPVSGDGHPARRRVGVRHTESPFVLSSIQKFVEQLLFQMTPGGLFDGASFRRDRFLFCQSLPAGARINVPRQMRDLRSTCADPSFVRSRIGIHLVKNNTGRRCPLLEPESVMPALESVRLARFQAKFMASVRSSVPRAISRANLSKDSCGYENLDRLILV
jgi:hypothetical protein